MSKSHHARGGEQIVAHQGDIADQEHARTDARYTSLALRWIQPQHVGRALDHLAKSYARAVGKGDMTPAELDALEEHHVDGHLANIAKQNPDIAAPKRAPKPRSW